MSSSQADAKSSSKRAPVEVVGWNELIRYTQFICQGSDKKVKICTIDEEQEEIRIENKDEFEMNVKYARDHGLKSLSLVVYINDVHIFDGIYHLANNEKSLPVIVEEKEKKIVPLVAFPGEKLQILIDNVLADKWYIPVKADEALGACLLSAIELAREGKLESNIECKQFIETIVPEAFRKLQNTQSVFSWPREIQYGIFDMLELLIDLVGTRLRHPPVPVTLLNTLALTFDTNITFAQKHKQEQLPTRRVYALPDEEFLRTSGNDQMPAPYGWLRSLIQRFIAQNGLTNIRFQFELSNNHTQTLTAVEYNALLKIFTKCHQCIDARRFRTLFARPIRQAVQFVLNKKKTEVNIMDDKLTELTDTLLDICFNYEMNDEISELVQQTPPVTELPVPQPIAPTKKTKSKDCYERLADDLRSLSMGSADAEALERKNVKKQRTDEQVPMPLFTRSHLTDCIDELLTSSEKRSLKRKHLKEQQRSSLTLINGGNVSKKESKRSNTISVIPKSYDRSDPVDIVRFFTPLKLKVAALYDELETATCRGHLRDVLKIEEKLKLLRPYSARFIADENTPDGTSMRPGQAFRKGWILLNDGSLPWASEDVQLINLADGIQVVQQPVVPVTAPYGRAQITVDYVCSEEPGTYESKWILTYRQQTFGPMIWCSIEVANPKNIERNNASPFSFSEFKESFELIDVPLPACFDLTKPFNPQRSSFILPRLTSTEASSDHVDLFNDNDHNSAYSFGSDTDSLSAFLFSSVPSPPLLRQVSDNYCPINPSLEDPTSLIELAPPAAENKPTEAVVSRPNIDQRQPARLSPPLDFVDSVVTNLFTVAKQAGSTAKAIFHTLQALEEPNAPVAPQGQEQPQPTLINTSNSNQTSADDFFEHVENVSNPDAVTAQEPMQMLIEMGFANRAKNQRLLAAHQDDLAKVIELLTLDSTDDSDWFAHRH